MHWAVIASHSNRHGIGDPGRDWLDRSLSGARSSGRDRIVASDGSDEQRQGKPPYVLSAVCGGCHRARAEETGAPCYDVIRRRREGGDSNGTATTTHLDAMRHVGKSVAGCGACDPDACYERYGVAASEYKFKYWRFDRTAPEIASASGLYFPSVPDRLRVPPTRFDDIEDYIRNEVYPRPDPKNTTSAFLFEYNPSLAALPVGTRRYLPEEAVYAVALRLTPSNRCFDVSLEDSLPEDVKQTSELHVYAAKCEGGNVLSSFNFFDGSLLLISCITML